MQRRQFLRVLGGGAILAAVPALPGCSSALPDAALAAWRPPTDDGDVRRWVLSHAILAPHSHNLQSWLVDLREPDVVTLTMDLSRLLPETDPFGRQLVMSHGTFLEVLDLAARERGYRAEIEPFPDGPYPAEGPDARRVARIRLVADPGVPRDPLFRQVFARHTNREPYAPRVPEPDALRAITEAVGAAARPGFLTTRDGAEIAAHRRLAKQAWATELVTPRTLLESYRWLRIGPTEIARHRDGIALNEPGVRFVTALGLFDRTKASAPDSAEIRGQMESFDAAIDATPAFFWMITPDNARLTQLNAGRAYVRAQLAATAHGLSMHPLQQALQEYPEQAAAYRAVHERLGAAAMGGTLQMWARLGYGPAIPPAPRRGLAAHLVGGADAALS